MGNQAIVRHGAYLVAMVLLCAPAIWNGFPLMFDDVGGYLERWPTASLALGRSTVYGSLVWFTSGTHFIPAIVVQALITVFVVNVAVKVFLARKRPPWLLTTIIAAMAAVTGVAMFVSKVMPDAWAAPGVLGLYLLAWHTESLTNCERAVLVAIVAFAGAAHLATFGVLAGLSIVYVAAWLAGRWLGTTPEGMGVAIAAVWSGLLLLLAGNFIVAGLPTLPAEGDIFLLGRMIADGMADQVLAEECPRPDWQLCDYRNALPSYQEAFIFDSDSPLQKIGGEHDPRAHREITSIIAQSLTRHPFAHAERAVALTAAQFVNVGTGNAMEPLMSWHTRWALTHSTPWLVAPFDAARQQVDTIDLSAWSDWVVVPVSLAASFALPVIAVLLWRCGRRREAMLPASLLLALLGNAAICGIMTGSHERYQARLAWLAVLAVGLLAQPLRQNYPAWAPERRMFNRRLLGHPPNGTLDRS